MIIYLPRSEFKDDKWYEIFEVPDDIPLSPDWVIVPPPEEYKYPKFDYIDMQWHEDKDKVLAELATENKTLKARLEMSEGAILDLAEMLVSR